LLTFGRLVLVDQDGKPVAEQRRRLSLLVLLAVAGSQGLSRDKLTALLWPESPTENARHALQQLVYYLRREVAEEVFLGTDPLRLNPALVTSDVADFEAALDRDARADAVALYRGSFLDGFFLDGSAEFERWAEEERARLAAAFHRALYQLAKGEDQARNHTAAIGWWRRLAEAEPLSGRAAAGLIKALAEGGDHAAALRHAERYASIIREEVGGEVEQAVAELVAELRQAGSRPPPLRERPPAGNQPDRPATASDRYRIQGELGRGGMATVYLAQDLRHDRQVALKVLQPEFASALGSQRFLREIELSSNLQHPNILPLFDSGIIDLGGGVLPYFTMPVVEGESVAARLARENQLELDDALTIAGDVAAALDYAHARGVVHRDIKPENILISGGRSIVADFGIALAVSRSGDQRLTQTGVVVGTAAYMSPEQGSAGDLDGRADIYGLGCVLYEMLAGVPPFLGPTAQAVLARHAVDPVPSLRTLRPAVPLGVERAIERALAKVPADRFPTAAQFVEALHAAPETAPTAASAPRAAPSPAVRRGVLAAGAVLLVTLAGAGVWLRARPPAEAARDADLLAVAPFEVLDPSLELWREGMGDVLAHTLDGAGPLRTVSPSVVLRRWKGRGDQASAEELGRRTGAGLVVYGAVVPRGRDSVTLRAALLDRAGGMGKTDIEVSGEAARIGELADSLGIRALRVLSSGRTIGSVRRTSIGSTSLPALKAFLQGEQFYRRALWDSALTRYDQAIGADSAFALALFRMALVLGWRPPTADAYGDRDEYYMRRATLHNHGLPPRDSLLIVADSFRLAAQGITEPEAWARMTLRSLAPVEEAVRRYPEDPMVWFELGEWRMPDGHDAWPIAAPPAVSLEASSRAIALDPGFAPPYEHMPQLLLALGRPEEARRYAVTYLALDPNSPDRSWFRLAALLLDQSDSGRAEAERMLDTASVLTVWGTGLRLGSWPDTAETAVRLMRRLGEPGRAAGGTTPWVIDTVMWPQYLAYVLAFRGHLREAFAADERLLRQPSASQWSDFLSPILDLSLFGIVPDSLARATFGRALKPAADWGDTWTHRHLRGLPWWLLRGDTAALARFGPLAARAARTPANPRAGLRARLLGEMSAGFLDLARGDSLAAIRKLSAIPDTLCLADFYTANCFHLNLTLARLLTARSEDRRAAELLERWRWSGSGTPMFVLATLELGRIAERLGDRRKAAEHYRFVVAAWRRPDPELLPYVAEAREGLARLGVE
jgi:serine/threonine-protein kinase